MRAACAVAAVSVSVGCGAEETGPAEGAEKSAPQRLSARLSDRTTYWFDGEPMVSRARGAFDWTARRGFVVERDRSSSDHLIQIGDTCYRRFDKERWKRFRALDPGGLCSSARFGNPATVDELMARVAEGWRKVDRVRLRGVWTTHYRGELNIGAVRGPIELWVDDEGIVRRERQAGDEPQSYLTVRDYYDFGVDVRVRRPTTGGSR